MDFTWNKIEDESDIPLGNLLVTVTCDRWDKPKTMCMTWEEATIRGKQIRRWIWYNTILRMDAWHITHWAYYPEPAEQ